MQDFTKIRIFDEYGYELQIQRFFNFTFEIKTSSVKSISITNNYSGYIIGDASADQKNENTYTFSNGSISDCLIHVNDERITDINDISTDFINSVTNINLSLFIDSSEYTLDISNNISDLIVPLFSDPIKIFTGDYIDSSYLEYKIKSFDFSTTFKSTLKTFILDSITQYNSDVAYNSEDDKRVKTLFPYYKFYASYNQEKISCGLVSAATFFILDEQSSNTFSYPISDIYDLKLYTNSSTGELQFITNTMDDSSIVFSNELNKTLDENVVSLATPTSNNSYSSPTPLAFSIGFTTDIEGQFQNTVELYLNNRNDGSLYSLGFIIVNTEAIGEDERYRTIFTNFGVPDPIEYQEVFKEADVYQDGLDYNLINKKSKELFLTYDQIFPYAGTYKSLINAVKFLGYDDIYFREYYKLMDYTQKSKILTYESIDMTTGETLQMKLSKAGISLEDFLKYKKLNQISIIYHINQKDDEEEIISYNYKNYLGKISSATKLVEVPNTINVYDYQTSELLAKLFSLKKWLEKYLIPANAYISDVTGEGVYFHRFKNLAYETVYNTIDYQVEANLTPFSYKLNENSNKLLDSSAIVTCSLYEFDNTKFKDYDLYPIRRFINKLLDVSTGTTNTFDASIKEYVPDNHVIDDILPISNPLSTVLPIDEFAYEIKTSPDSGSLYEYASKDDITNPIYIKDNEIYNYDPNKLESYIDSSYLPIIIIRSGNIRKTYGNWQNNIVWTISSVVDQTTGGTYYQMKNINGEYHNYIGTVMDERGIVIGPNYVTDKDVISTDSSLVYSEKTKWDVPLLIATNYKVKNNITKEQKPIFDLSGNYVLEILDGEIQFRDVRIDNVKNDYTANEVLQTDVLFEMQDPNSYETTYEQLIYPTFTYKTKRYPIYEYKVDSSINSKNYGKTLIKNKLKELNKEKQTFIDSSLLSENTGSYRRKIRARLLRSYIKDFDLLKYYYGENIDYSILLDTSIDASVLDINKDSSTLVYNDTVLVNESIEPNNYIYNDGTLTISGFNLTKKIIEGTYIILTYSGTLSGNADANGVVTGDFKIDNTSYPAALEFNNDAYTLTITNVPSESTVPYDVTFNIISKNTELKKSLDEIDASNVYPIMKHLLDGSAYIAGTGDYDTINGLFDTSTKFVTDLNNYRYKDQNSFYVSSKLENDLNYEMSITLNHYDENYYNEFYSYIKNSDFLNVNKFINVKVNRLGAYDILVKGYDKYNNTFVNTSNTQTLVYGSSPKINVYANQSNSNNSSLYTIGNKDGVYSLDASYIFKDTEHKDLVLPKIYRINNFFLAKDINNLSYYNISYAIDTPKQADYIYLENITERATKILDLNEANNTITLQMLDENPNRQEIYIKNLLTNLYVYDESKKSLLATFENLSVLDFYKQESISDTNYYDDSSITLYNNDLKNNLFTYFKNNDINTLLENNNIRIFVSNVQEYSIAQDNIIIDSSNKETTLGLVFDTSTNMVFHEGDVIKVIYKTTFETENYISVFNTYIGETAYRIKSCSKEDSSQYYILDGLIDFNKWDYNDNIKISISYANTNFVNYIVRNSAEADEISYYNNYNDSLDFTTQLTFDASTWLGNEYIDSNYSGYITDFNIEDASKVWIDASENLYTSNLYKYQQIPITTGLGRYILLDSEDTEKTFSSYKNEWKWQTNSIEDLDNWEDYKTYNTEDNVLTLFRSINNWLSVKTILKGRQDIELTTTDIYGNRIINKQTGLIFVS